MPSKIDLSIVIPAYNEEHKIHNDIIVAQEFLKKSQLSGEIIVVDDGSSDNTAQSARDTVAMPDIDRKVIVCEKNMGKGFAVRKGITASRGEYVLMVDCGCCVPYSYAQKGIELINSGQCQIAHGSRKMPESIIIKRQILLRRILSKVFRRFFIFFMGIPQHFTDTQCGFKIYKGEVARELYNECHINGFAFDIDILVRAIRKNYKVLEFPVQWKSDPDTRLIPLSTSWKVLFEFIKIKRSIAQIEGKSKK